MRQSSASRAGPLHNRRSGMCWQPFVVCWHCWHLGKRAYYYLMPGNARSAATVVVVRFCSLLFPGFFCCCRLSRFHHARVAGLEASRIHAHTARGGVLSGLRYLLSCDAVMSTGWTDWTPSCPTITAHKRRRTSLTHLTCCGTRNHHNPRNNQQSDHHLKSKSKPCCYNKTRGYRGSNHNRR
jgi:hypothetical protein